MTIPPTTSPTQRFIPVLGGNCPGRNYVEFLGGNYLGKNYQGWVVWYLKEWTNFFCFYDWPQIDGWFTENKKTWSPNLLVSLWLYADDGEWFVLILCATLHYKKDFKNFLWTLYANMIKKTFFKLICFSNAWCRITLAVLCVMYCFVSCCMVLYLCYSFFPKHVIAFDQFKNDFFSLKIFYSMCRKMRTLERITPGYYSIGEIFGKPRTFGKFYLLSVLH